MTYHFTRRAVLASRKGDVEQFQERFDATSLPAAKAICRKTWAAVASTLPLNHGQAVKVELYSRSGWSFGDAGHGRLIATLVGVPASRKKPQWKKAEPDANG